MCFKFLYDDKIKIITLKYKNSQLARSFIANNTKVNTLSVVLRLKIYYERNKLSYVLVIRV